MDADLLLTLNFARDEWLTFWVGGSVAPRGSTARMPLLDFPFLYARYAVLKTTAVARLGIDYDLPLSQALRFRFDAVYFYLPVIDAGFSVELGGSLRWLVTRRWALEAGARLEVARYPAGTQFHAVPFVDLLLAL